MERIRKKITVSSHPSQGGITLTGVIDTGTRKVVVPRRKIRGVLDLSDVSRTGTIRGFGTGGLRGSIHAAFVRIPSGRCSTMTDVFVPFDEDWPHSLIGSEYLQQVRAEIIYRGKHPVFCPQTNPPQEFEDFSFGEYP